MSTINSLNPQQQEARESSKRNIRDLLSNRLHEYHLEYSNGSEPRYFRAQSDIQAIFFVTDILCVKHPLDEKKFLSSGGRALFLEERQIYPRGTGRK